MKPAPVRSRSSLTFAAEMSAMWVAFSCSCPRSRPDRASEAGDVVRRRPKAQRSAGDGRLLLLGRLAGKLGGDLIGRGLRCGLRCNRLRGRAGTWQEVILFVEIRRERQRSTTRERGDELFGRRLVVLRLGGHRDLGLGLRRGAGGALLLALDACLGDKLAQ